MRISINPKYSHLVGFINAIPSIFEEQGEIVYNARNTIKVFEVNGLMVNVKSFKKPIFINRFVYMHIRKSKAERSFLNAFHILGKDIKTPDPIAYIELSRNGLIGETYYISVHEQVDGTMKEIYRQGEEKSKDLIQAFILFTADLHKKGIMHKDYSPGNILYKKTSEGYQFYLIDLNRMKFKEPDIMDGCKSFSRIMASENTLDMISEEYSKIRKYDKKSCRTLIHLYNRRFWKKHLARHPESRYEIQ